MKIPGEEIFAFHKKRVQCHVDSLNYFAGLLGYHFPEHDNDKNTEPYRTGYAYAFYASYHPECVFTDPQREIVRTAQADHHRMAPHHIEHYGRGVLVPKIYLTEMICDWHSADFEQTNVQHQNAFNSVADFFERVMKPYEWTDAQIEQINNAIEIINRDTDFDAIMSIWSKIQD